MNKPTKTEIQSINNKPKETNPGMDLSQLNMFSFYSDLFEIDLVPAVISPINKAV